MEDCEEWVKSVDPRGDWVMRADVCDDPVRSEDELVSTEGMKGEGDVGVKGGEEIGVANGSVVKPDISVSNRRAVVNPDMSVLDLRAGRSLESVSVFELDFCFRPNLMVKPGFRVFMGEAVGGGGGHSGVSGAGREMSVRGMDDCIYRQARV